MHRQGPVIEVTFLVAPDVVAKFDEWLEEHLRSAGPAASIASNPAAGLTDSGGRVVRLCHYRTEHEDGLDAALGRSNGNQLDDNLADVEAAVADVFGDDVELNVRILREDSQVDAPPGMTPNCLNCGAHLRGQYCGNCGQRSRSRLISLWELISDAFGDLFEIDSRLWRTLIPLTIRPGQLTHDYLQGRRARYMPPFRMYLVLSLLFFVVAFFDPREELGFLFLPPAETEAPAETADDDETAPPTAPEADAAGDEARRVRQELLEELAAEGIIVADPEAGTVTDPDSGLKISLFEADEAEVECQIEQSDVDDMPGWLARRLTIERLTRICERTQVDDGRALINKLLDNIPAALIVLLPLMALVLKVLYPLSRRYYVEHLLFFVHFHAFFFLILTLQILCARIAPLLRIPEAVYVLAIVVTSFYVPVYLFMAMRKVYGQGRLITFIKYGLLTIAYIVGFGLTMLSALAIAAFSI